MAGTTPLGNLTHLEKPDVGLRANQWGDDLNKLFDGFDDAVAGVLSKSVAGTGDVSLTNEEAGHKTIILTGTLSGNRNVIVPTAQRNYRFINGTDGAFTLTVKTAAGTGVSLRRGEAAALSCDGTNVIRSGPAPRFLGAAGGSSNAFTLTPSPALTAYDVDQAFSFRANHTIDGAATLDISSLGPKDIKRWAGGTKVATAAGDITIGQHVEVVYDGTDMVWINSVALASESAAGIVELATAQETAAGSDAQRAVTPAGAAAAFEPLGTTSGINTQTDNYTLALTDKGKIVEGFKATGMSIEVPANASVAFPIGTIIDLCQMGAGQVTIVAGSGVTIRSSDGKLKLRGQYSTATLYKRGTDEWVLCGDLA